MRRYSYLHPIFYSFFSRALYRDVFLRWRGYGFVYMLIMLCVLSVPLIYATCRLVYQLNATSVLSQAEEKLAARATEEGVPFDRAYVFRELNALLFVLSSLPEMTLRQGELYTDNPAPLSLRHPETGNLWVYVDTGTEATLPLPAEEAPPVQLGHDHLWLTEPGTGAQLSLSFKEVAEDDDRKEATLNRFFSLLSHLPALRFKDELLSMDATSPYVLEDNQNYAWIEIDTRELPSFISTAPLRLSRSGLFLEEEGQQRFFRYRDITYENLKQGLETLVERTKHWLWRALLLFVPLAIGVTFGTVLLLLLLFGVIAQGIAAVIKIRHFLYQDMVRLAAVAFTPALVLKLFLPAFPGSGFFLFLITCYYLYFGLTSTRNEA